MKIDIKLHENVLLIKVYQDEEALPHTAICLSDRADDGIALECKVQDKRDIHVVYKSLNLMRKRLWEELYELVGRNGADAVFPIAEQWLTAPCPYDHVEMHIVPDAPRRWGRRCAD